jgi:Zn-dependent metalloprotease
VSHKHRDDRACCAMIPPHVHRHIATHARKKSTREKAARALEVAEGIRTARTSYAADRARGDHSYKQGSPPPSITTTDALNNELSHDNRVARRDGEPKTGDEAVDEAHDGAAYILRHFRERHGRNSLDDAGMDLFSVVHFGRDFGNAMWTGREMVYGDGDRELFNRFTASFDVIVHEFCHGLTEHTCDLVYRNQPGALNEHVSDAFGAALRQLRDGATSVQADWLIGKELLADGVNGMALRSMIRPGTAYDDPNLGKDPQPDHVDRLWRGRGDSGGVHINSGIPNKAFALAASDAGGFAADTVLPVWYATLTDPRIAPRTQFREFALTTVDHARGLGGTRLEQAVRGGWLEVGVLKE